MGSIQKDICIIGGGASGLAASISAAKNGADVILIEKNEILGRKILSTGNGRCNFVNSDYSKEIDYYFHSNSGGLDVIDKDNYHEIISLMEEIGVVVKDINGYFYPYTNQAKTIQQAFEIYVRKLSIEYLCNTKVTGIINLSDGSFKVKTSNGDDIFCKKVIIATGGLAAPKLGSDGDGFRFAKKLGVNVINPYPALVGLNYSKEIGFNSSLISGLRCQGIVTFDDTSFEGEIQFTKDGISGYPVMCLSHKIGAAKRDNKNSIIINVNFLPYLTKDNAHRIIAERLTNKELSIKNALNGMISDKAIDCITDRFAREQSIKLSSESPCDQLSDDIFDHFISLITNFSIAIENTRGFNDAQTTGGGIDCRMINPSTMECKTIKNLYFVGEVLDVDGICGGYNLHFAFKTGLIAGLAASLGDL